MMKINTKHFGEVEIDEERIVVFEQGIFGFEDSKRYVMLYEDEDTKNGLCWMQSVDDEGLSLPVINPMFWFPDYSPEVADEQIARIGALKEEDLNLFSVVVITDNIESMTTNLKAPIVINIQTKKGMQVIVANEEYEIKHNLYEQMKLMKAGE
ncbi:flagellar assembly protein FliW [Petrocella sp. FN5]|uniref:flagellar assembly protein FliW n=1 Tax=Petrocella sp. FN5 TaxID=3032002 RepID=UPI0023DC25B3|nr:flagellar assembly protein FliW [Petrocella sp. FN5]MDF1615990.1 flagellar assembly protein FliW [Petrocella sp. FN5]